MAGLAEAPLARRRPPSVIDCPRETAVFEAIAFGRLSEASEPELTAHAAEMQYLSPLLRLQPVASTVVIVDCPGGGELQ